MALSDADISTALQAMVKTATLNANLGPLVAAANAMALSDIRSAWLAKGYKPATIELWDDFNVKQKFQALYWCGQLDRALVTKDASVSLDALDQRKSLAEMDGIMVGGVLVLPDATTLQVRYGSLTVPATQPHNPLTYDPRHLSRRLNP